MGASQREAVTAFVALGANLGDARQTVLQAIESLGRLPRTRVLARSRLYCTAPHEAQGPDFVNAVARLETGLAAPHLLQALQDLEHHAGRQRPYPNAPRTLDLDLLLYGQARVESPKLTVPHPRMHSRAFVLWPLADVAPALVSAEDLARVRDQALHAMEDV
jgi:2-amino-4-hydroxy-6-hydroxymethyldihydropteridine diphosphokinase